MVDVSNYPTHKQTYEPIATQTLSSAASSVTFSNIPQTFKDLVITIKAKNNGATNPAPVYMRYNSDTGTNYSVTRIYGNGSSAASDRFSNQSYGMDVGYMPHSGGGFGNINISILSYSSNSVYKTLLADWESQAGTAANSQYVCNVVGLWRSTSAVTSISMNYASDTFYIGSQFSLYGIAG